MYQPEQQHLVITHLEVHAASGYLTCEQSVIFLLLMLKPLILLSGYTCVCRITQCSSHTPLNSDLK